MKPNIKTRLANIAAKLAGSKDYDSKVVPKTPLEFYMNEIPVVPKPTNRDAGKNLIAGDNGTYELQSPTTPVDVPQPTVDDAGKVLSVDESGDYTLAKTDSAFYVNIVFSNSVYTASKTFAEVLNAYENGKVIIFRQTDANGKNQGASNYGGVAVPKNAATFEGEIDAFYTTITTATKRSSDNVLQLFSTKIKLNSDNTVDLTLDFYNFA